MGLKIMEYRARMLGGTINFEEPNPGTRIVLSAPLHLLRNRKTSCDAQSDYFRITGTSV